MAVSRQAQASEGSSHDTWISGAQPQTRSSLLFQPPVFGVSLWEPELMNAGAPVTKRRAHASDSGASDSGVSDSGARGVADTQDGRESAFSCTSPGEAAGGSQDGRTHGQGTTDTGPPCPSQRMPRDVLQVSVLLTLEKRMAINKCKAHW